MNGQFEVFYVPDMMLLSELFSGRCNIPLKEGSG